MYQLLRRLLFCFDPEKVHYFSMNSLQFLCRIPLFPAVLKKLFQPKKKAPYHFLGLNFPNRVGLGAGFDKNARYLDELELLGFGFVEIGTVTPLPQAGNERPRLFRLPADKALLNRMGFNNDGAAVIAGRLEDWRKQNKRLIIGGNIGKNKITANEDAWKDYAHCFHALHPYVDYFVVNVSSPNTPGLRALQEKDALRKILGNLQELNKQYKVRRPVLLKIAPDLLFEQIDEVVELALEINLDGLVASNTTIDRNLLSKEGKLAAEKYGAGGLSGLPVKNKSTEIVAYIHQKTNGRIPIIASGGIFSGIDALEKINAGASLVQVWTGFIYNGPAIVKAICNKLPS
ncbi:MAG: quinone-dependent dihydroorotate dehydrogenase [Ferruginibacter sp.]|nr:quinone-dependent dihydroorotate dehydrogenase [Ferruginibacter sp.]